MIKKTGENEKKAMTKSELEEALINNFTNLQKVLTNLAIKFEDLSSNMSKMLQLFEISAKTFSEKQEITGTNKEDKQLLEKLDSLLDQNKTIAKGILMMEGRIKERTAIPQQEGNINLQPKQLPRY
jgi:hypothetical protein